MSQFSYSDYQNVVARAQSNDKTNAVKVGFFKLADDGNEAFVRINCSSIEDLKFATVHQLGADQHWMKVSCLNEVGSYDDKCPFCREVANGNTKIGKAAKKVYVPMMVAYKDPTTGAIAKAVPVIWERPAGFAREIANLLRDYQDLKGIVLKVTRNGVARSKDTTYSIGYIPMFDKEEIVPKDFSAFDNFRIEKHSYWEKTAEEIQEFLDTGAFPEVKKSSGVASAPVAKASAPVQEKAVEVEAPVYTAPKTEVKAEPVKTAPAASSFEDFSF